MNSVRAQSIGAKKAMGQLWSRFGSTTTYLAILAVLSTIALVGAEILQDNLPGFIGQSTQFSIFFGGFVFLVGLMFQIRRILEQREGATDRRGRLMRALEDCELDENQLVQLCETASNLRFAEWGTWGPIARDRAERRIDEVISFLEELGTERLQLRTEGTTELIELTNRARVQVRATSIATLDSEFWKTNAGTNYVDAMRNALETKRSAGFQIRRIFLCAEEPDADLRAAMEHQRQIGVQVRFIDTSKLQSSEFEDVVIFDDEIVFRVKYTADGRVVGGTTISAQPPEVKDKIQLFEELWGRSSLPDFPCDN